MKTQKLNIDVSLIIMDLDNFKNINDKYGHSRGDDVLREVAKISLACIRKTDRFTRYGGEEFGIILENANQKEAFGVAEKIRGSISKYGESMKNNITVSLGISQCKSDDTTATLIERADKAMYISKADGKNRCTLL